MHSLSCSTPACIYVVHEISHLWRCCGTLSLLNYPLHVRCVMPQLSRDHLVGWDASLEWDLLQCVLSSKQSARLHNAGTFHVVLHWDRLTNFGHLRNFGLNKNIVLNICIYIFFNFKNSAPGQNFAQLIFFFSNCFFIMNVTCICNMYLWPLCYHLCVIFPKMLHTYLIWL